jgi:hypothetical protein
VTLARLLLPAALLLAACSSAPDPEESVQWRPVAPRSPLVLDDQNNSPNVPSPLPPGTRIALVDVPRSNAGIPLPDGTFLPALNGVPRSGKIDRPPQHGPIQPVVGIVVDDARNEWYEHQDGSMTTSRFVWNKNRSRWEPITLHAIAAPK